LDNAPYRFQSAECSPVSRFGNVVNTLDIDDFMPELSTAVRFIQCNKIQDKKKSAVGTLSICSE
jgi:hypothetical protein